MSQATTTSVDKAAANTGNRIKVLYIAGTGRCGSTILSNVLGEVDGFFSSGEIWNLWQRGLIDNQKCGCGQHFQDCEFWSRVIDRAYGNMPQFDVKALLEAKDRVRNLETLNTVLPGGKRSLEEKLTPFLPYMSALYQAIHEVSGCRVLIDSSKIPLPAYILSLLPNIDLHILHLVREPHAVAYSWLKKKRYEPGNQMEMERFNPLFSALLWATRNIMIELLWAASDRYMLLRYEDFVDSPQDTLSRISTFINEDVGDTSFLEDHTVCLTSNHNVSGNPSRFQAGQVTLKIDNQWKSEMRQRDKAVVNVLLPFLWRYGYR